jgi:hypothetical protein
VTASLKKVTSEVANCNLHLVAVKRVRWGDAHSQPADDYTFFCANRDDNNHLGTGFFVHKGIISAVQRVELISDRLSYKTLRGNWHDIVLNVQAPTEDTRQYIQKFPD